MATEPKEMLRMLAEDIRAIMEQDKRALVPSISPEAGEWFSGAVAAYLTGEANLEKALGLTKGRGRPRLKGASKGAKQVAEKKKEGSWIKVADDLQQDSRGLQRKLNRFGDRLDAERNAEIGAKIAERISKKPKPRPRRFPLGD